MTLDTLVVAIVAILVGAGLVVAGYRFFLLLLPIFGFVAGFYVGSAAVTAIFGNGFLSDVTGWIVGLHRRRRVRAAVVLLLHRRGDHPGRRARCLRRAAVVADGSTSATSSSSSLAAGGAIVLADRRGRPGRRRSTSSIAVTAIIGAATAVAGVLLLFGTIKLGALQQGPVDTVVKQGPVWVIAFVVLAVVGIVAQVRTFPTYVLDPEGPRFA